MANSTWSNSKWFILILFSILLTPVRAEQWKTHFAYNNVTQIALARDKVYALSDGSLFSVNKISGTLQIYNRMSGLNSTNITCIYYDGISKQLIIGYQNGKIDLLSNRGVQYVGELYDKDMTQRKTINNVTIYGRTAYLSTAFGIQTLDLRTNRLVDSYWLRPGGLETDIQDVVIQKDSIYAFTADSMFAASLYANIVDYTYWKREIRSGRVAPNPEKGVHYQDTNENWYAAHGDGILRVTPTEQINYKPQGPLTNIPYRLTAQAGKLWMVAGGRWDAQFLQDGDVMIYDGTKWTNITMNSIAQQTRNRTRDFMNTAVDPNDKNHYFITSYGTGLYEFKNDILLRQEIAGGNNTLTSTYEPQPYNYTRLDFAIYDNQGRLWFLQAGSTGQLQCLEPDNTWHAVDVLVNGALMELYTPGGLILDSRNTNHKWIATARYNTFLCLVDDGGTPFDFSDDKTISRSDWIDQEGHSFAPNYIYQLMQDSRGRIWMATEQGIAYIDATDYFTSNAVFRPVIMDNNGENPMRTNVVKAICEDKDGKLWVGTESLGIYVLNNDASEIEEQYTSDNSAMPNNSILSLACDTLNGKIYIGTADGLVEYDPKGKEEGLKEETNASLIDETMNDGSMLQWKLHFSYSGAQEIVASPSAIYAVANGSLFSIDRADESISYWNKSTGLNGTSVTHIAYDAAASTLIVSYADGRLDLLHSDKSVTQMPELSLKAGTLATDINCITVGARYTYLGTSFGIIAMNTRKGEIADTYYIGEDAASLEVQQIVETADSLFAFSYDRMYKASLHDNLVDFNFWKYDSLPCVQVQQAAVLNNTIYTIQHDSLYRREGKTWNLVASNSIEWIHVSGNQLLTFERDKGLLRLSDKGELVEISPKYAATDAVYSNGEYWLAEEGQGVVRLDTDGDTFFRPEGPMSNFGYCLHAAHNQVYVAPGGRWEVQFGRQSSLSIYDGQQWIGIPWPNTRYYTNHDIRDAVSYAVDANDPSHFYVATYGTGLFEFRNYKAVNHFDSINSTLRKTGPGVDNYYFTRTDGALMDEQGNLWVLNSTSIGQPLHVMSPDGLWHGIPMVSEGQLIQFTTPGAIWIDKRNSAYKWMFDQRVNPGVILMNDGETPTYSGDDYCIKRNSFVDQNGHTLTPAYINCITQDQTNRIWIGTDKGIITIPADVDFFSSNACKRIIIDRNDGTNLGDYLLGDEQINCMAPDGGNRMWIGTANSGLYLIEYDTITVAHFTENNSLLPSNVIQSIAVVPATGEVFVGTDRGIASYRGDASEARSDMSSAYVYPNPVRPDYNGYISIAGLMDNTTVNIIDAGGNLVCKTRSHGGTAVWDGRLSDGRRATPGVYTALCNADGGHIALKILVIR